MRLTATARCLGCAWVTPEGDWAAVDRVAEKHTRAGHATAVTVRPQ